MATGQLEKMVKRAKQEYAVAENLLAELFNTFTCEK
jgi:hypothetical protein